MLVVVPTSTDWNDFGYYFGVTLHLLVPGRILHSLEMRMVFDGYDRSEKAINELLGQKAWALLSEWPRTYCSIFTEIEHYRTMTETFGFPACIASLRGLGDAVIAVQEANNPERIRLIESEAFALGALRYEGAYSAFRRGAKYLRPQPIVEVDDSAKSIFVTAHLPSAENAYHIAFNFENDELFRNRLAVLIGKNGTGKTQLLRAFINGFLSENDTNPHTRPTIVEPKTTFNRMLVFSSVAFDVYPRSIPIWKGLDYAYFSMTANPVGEVDAFTDAFTDCLRDDGKFHFVKDDRPLFPNTGRMALLDTVVNKLGFSEFVYLPLKIIEGLYDFHTVQHADRQYFPFRGAQGLNEKRRLVLTQAIDRKMRPMLFGIGPGERELSSGEMALLRFAAQAAGSAERGCLFLFDEPETHLHPNFISEFVTILNTILIATNSVAVIVTHSAYVVREVPRQRVRVFDLDGRVISIDQPRLQTFGASIDSISQYVFSDTSISHQYQETLIEWLDSLGPNVSIEDVLRRFGDQMNSETLSFVARMIAGRQQ
jgi:energy-coupling factor transporter ATP-binding protein EcfA2